MQKEINTMKAVFFSLLMLVIASVSTISCAQESPCNRAAFLPSYEKRLPEEICLPEGYMLRAILADTVDIDGDGNADYAIKLEKINALDGDTNLVVLYRKNPQGLLEQWKVFDNLYPVFFKDYDYEYASEYKDNSLLAKLKRRYHYALSSDVLFEKNTIVVKFNTDGGGGLLLYFSFDINFNGWKLNKQVGWFGRMGHIDGTPDYDTVIPKNKYDIEDFNMLDYLDE